jgi:Flp pilus assembly protein TadG
MREDRGATLVEFTLIFMLLLMLTFGIVEFSLLLYDKAMLTNAAREGARAGILAQRPRVSDAEIQDVVMSYARDFLVTFGDDTLEAGDITITPANRASAPYGTDLTVTVNYRYNFLVLPNLANLGPINLRSTAVMKLE